MSAYDDKLRKEKKQELSQKVSSTIVNDIWEMSLRVNTAEEFVDYLMTITDQAAIEEFFNKCHDKGGKFCGGGTSSKGLGGPNRGPGTHIPAPVDYFKSTIKSGWQTRQQRLKSQKLKSVTGPLLGITGPYGVRVSRLNKADITKFSEKDLGVLKTRLQNNQRKFNKYHTKNLVKVGTIGAFIGIAASVPGTTVVINPAAIGAIAYGYGLSRWKTKHIPGQITRIDRELARRQKTKISASSEDIIAFQDGFEDENLPTLEQEIAAARKELEGLNLKNSSKPSQTEINEFLDLLADAMVDEDMPEEGMKAISKLMS